MTILRTIFWDYLKVLAAIGFCCSLTACCEIRRPKPVACMAMPAPVPVEAMPETTPVKAVPAPAPVKAVPAPAPVKAVPAPAPVKAVPAPVPVKAVPAPVPVKAVPAPAPVKAVPAPVPVKAVPSESEQKKSKLEDYSVTVASNEHLVIPGPPGELRVWIGISSKAPRIQPGMSTETKALEAVGETAKIKPFALGIDVEHEEIICKKIDPSGSEFRFKIIPKEAGTFTVGADVELYASKDCSGPPVPKSAKSVTVKVSVNKVGLITHATEELVKAAWKAFLAFWDKVLLLIFALLLFLIRKRLSKWFGFRGDQ